MHLHRPFLAILAPLSLALGLYTVWGQEVAPTTRQIMGSSIFDWEDLPVKQTERGETRKVLRAPTATLDELECHVTMLKAGEMAHPAHQHPDEELIIVKEGTVESLVNGELKVVGPGSVIFQAANQMHCIKNVGDTPATYHVIKWNSPGMLAKKVPSRLKKAE